MRSEADKKLTKTLWYCGCLHPAPVLAQTTKYYIPQGVDGGGYRTLFTVTNLSASTIAQLYTGDSRFRFPGCHSHRARPRQPPIQCLDHGAAEGTGNPDYLRRRFLDCWMGRHYFVIFNRGVSGFHDGGWNRQGDQRGRHSAPAIPNHDRLGGTHQAPCKDRTGSPESLRQCCGTAHVPVLRRIELHDGSELVVGRVLI